MNAVRRLGSSSFRRVVWMGSAVQKRWFAGWVRPPLYEGSAFDDFLIGQPLNIPLRAFRAISSRRGTRGDGCTILIVNFNTGAFLKHVLPTIRRNSPPDIDVIVIDNASTDGSWAWLRTRPFGIRAVRSPVNLGHGRALDVGFLLARTPIVITLDPDAFPVSGTWLDSVLKPLGDPHVKAVGSWGRRERLHPAFAAYRRKEVLDAGISFHNYKPHLDTGEPFVFGENCFDTGEYLFERLGRDQVVLLPVERSKNGWGDIVGGVVYHHRAVTGYDASDETMKKELQRQRRIDWGYAVQEYTSKTS